MSSRRFTTIVNYLFIFLSINYSLYAIFATHFLGYRFVLIAFSVVVLLLNASSFVRIVQKRPIVFWLAWCLYAFMNYYLHPADNQEMTCFVLYGKIFIPLTVLMVVVKEYRQNAGRLLWFCFFTHAAYMLLGYRLDSGILNRINGDENQLGNSYAIISSFTLFYLTLLNRTKRLPVVVYIPLAVVIMSTLAMSGTRKAFGAGAVYILFWVLSWLKLKKVGSWIIVALFLGVAYWGHNQLIEKTFMGQRMEYFERQQQTLLPPGAPAWLSVFGDRAGHYYYGYHLFSQHPLLGMGTGQARIPKESGIMLYTHTEFMAQLVDQGLVGFLLFLAFYCWIAIHISTLCVQQRTTMTRPICICMLGGFAAIMFLSLTAWIWEFPHYFICLGYIICFCYEDSLCHSLVRHWRHNG